MITDLSHDNKYANWYSLIILNSVSRIDTTLKYEKHHILPRCFKLGGNTDYRNIVNLTPREHYVCHRLLSKMMIDGRKRRQMYFAVWKITHNDNQKVSSREYEFNKKNFTKSQKELWQDPEYREKQRVARAESYADPMRQAKHSLDIKTLMETPTYKEMCVRPMIDSHKTIDHSSKEWTERSFNSLESIAKSTAYSKTPESREKAKQRELSKGADKLSECGRNRNRKAVENGIIKYGSEEAFRKHHAESIRGRKKCINRITNEKRMFKPDSIPFGFELITKKPTINIT